MSATSGCEFWPSYPSAVWSWGWEESLNLSKFKLSYLWTDMISHILYLRLSRQHVHYHQECHIDEEREAQGHEFWLSSFQSNGRTALLRPLWSWVWTHDFHGTMKWEDKRCVSFHFSPEAVRASTQFTMFFSPCFCKHGKHRDGTSLGLGWWQKSQVSSDACGMSDSYDLVALSRWFGGVNEFWYKNQ